MYIGIVLIIAVCDLFQKCTLQSPNNVGIGCLAIERLLVIAFLVVLFIHRKIFVLLLAFNYGDIWYIFFFFEDRYMVYLGIGCWFIRKKSGSIGQANKKKS